MGPMVYTIASSESPKAAATPAKPIWLPASTALPTPPKTRTNVPTSSAKYLFMDVSSESNLLLRGPSTNERFFSSAQLHENGECSWPQKYTAILDVGILGLLPGIQRVRPVVSAGLMACTLLCLMLYPK